jgi:cytochrome c oxidase subunit 2
VCGSAGVSCRRRAALRAGALSLCACALCACAGEQAVLAPRGPQAAALAQLSWVLFTGGAAILTLVVLLTAWAALGDERRRRWMGNERFVLVAGLGMPVAVLTALLVYALPLTSETRAPVPGALRIEVVGERWWWRVRYLDAAGRVDFETANELRIPVDAPVSVVLSTADVIHSFWVPNLAGKLDMIPGHVNELPLRASTPGTYRGQCAEYCGGAHALMAFYVVVERPEAFERWRERQRADASEPGDAFLASGRDAFLAAGCGACHSVRGTRADGALGPDLTHVGGRVSIGAGILPNQVGTLAGWIASSQHLKPGNRMPSFPIFPGETLRALAAWLESLE